MKTEKSPKKTDIILLAKETQWLLDEKYHGERNKLFLADVARLEAGEPVDYVIGFTTFLDCYIDLSDSPLIPRTETEFWVERAVKEIIIPDADEKKTIRCLDIFSGSGCIGIALLKHVASATVDFGDDQTNCLRQMRKNIKKNDVDARARVYRSNCFKNIPRQRYDHIFANPPYIARERQRHVQRSVTAWEPRHALFAKDRGLYHIKKIIRQAPNFIKENGTIFIEFDSFQKEAIEKLIPRNQYTYTFWKDPFEKWRTVVLRKKQDITNQYIS